MGKKAGKKKNGQDGYHEIEREYYKKSDEGQMLPIQQQQQQQKKIGEEE